MERARVLDTPANRPLGMVHGPTTISTFVFNPGDTLYLRGGIYHENVYCALAGKKVELKVIIDPSVLGGLIAQVLSGGATLGGHGMASHRVNLGHDRDAESGIGFSDGNRCAKSGAAPLESSALRVALRDRLDRTVVVVSSKSGSTVETDSHRRAFEQAFRKAGLTDAEVARRIVVVTDPGSPLHDEATAAGYEVESLR